MKPTPEQIDIAKEEARMLISIGEKVIKLAEINDAVRKQNKEMREALRELYDLAYQWSNDKQDATLVKAKIALEQSPA